ncbi:MAG: acetoacetate--CoA ligase, partial [Pseudomonadota bacterium]|nr:acetoacetate--CoA ligase [Pseudomonadota bacterium]
DDALIGRIKATIREHTTARHVPAKVFQVTDIPRTRNNKIAELAVRSIIHHQPVKHVEVLSNPEALLLFKDLSDLNTP